MKIVMTLWSPEKVSGTHRGPMEHTLKTAAEECTQANVASLVSSLYKSRFLVVKGKKYSGTPVNNGKQTLVRTILIGAGAAAMGFCSGGERPGSTLNPAWASGDL